MKNVYYTSKKLGTIIISSESNHYTIFSKQLEARSLNQDEEGSLITQYSRLLEKPENIRLFAESKPWDSAAVQEFIQSEVKHWNSGRKFSVLSIYHSTTQEFIGFLQIKHSINDFADVGDGHPNVGEIIYIVDHAYWGKGYGTEIAILGKKLINHIISESAPGSTERDIKEIVATVHPSNEGSKKILQKTLKYQEPEEFTKFGDQPRLLFFKPLKNLITSLDTSKTDTPKTLIAKL